MLEAREISFGYEGRPLIYDGLNMSIAPGERVHLDAPSGFGKTTLCRLLAGYEDPISGEVLVDGAPLPARGACPVQLIGQHPERMLDPRMRMRDSLLEAGPFDESLNDRLGIREVWMSRFPHELSGGELQRFCIVRALMTGPRYLVADEISTMLDAVTQVRIWNAILLECELRNIGLVFTTHAQALANRLATRSVQLL